jgi:putative drug exporter of the RND superfamily
MVLVAWGAGLILLIWASLALAGSFHGSPDPADGPARQGSELLRAHGAGDGGGAQVVFVAPRGAVGAHRAALERSRARMAHLPHVIAVSDPLAPGAVARGGGVAYSTVEFDSEARFDPASLRRFEAATAAARGEGLEVEFGGSLGQAGRSHVGDGASELIGVLVALAVLLGGFGSVLGAGIPLLAAILGVVAGLSLLGILAAAIAFGSVSPTLATMMALGVGIDYALFLTTRFRQKLIDGSEPREAIAATMASSGRAVMVAALTVVVALCGLYGSGFAFIGRLGLAAAIAVAIAALAALTLVPALLLLTGRRIDRLRVRTPVAEPHGDHSRFSRYVETLSRRPVLFAGAGIAFLLVLAIPATSMRFGHLDAGSEASATTQRRAYDAIGAGFGAGANGPLTVVVDLAPGTQPAERQDLGRELRHRLGATPGVAAVRPPRLSRDRELMVVTVVPDSAPSSAATAALFDRLRERVLPAVVPAGNTAYVTGLTALQIEAQRAVASRLPLIVAFVVTAALLLLLVAFGSPVLALKAALLNLLSIGAAFGVVVAVFQWGWGAELLGLPGPVPIEAYVPMMMFTIVFGLSMDYEVFLLSRVREHWLSSGDNGASVAAGLASTARVISCAAAIMASVFLGFLVTDSVVVKMLALGLGVSVIVDATVIRLLIVPALMFVFGSLNWWQPRWLRWAG